MAAFSSAITGASKSYRGTFTVLPTYFLYRSSSGLTNTHTTPYSSSGRVVAISMVPSSPTKGM